MATLLTPAAVTPEAAACPSCGAALVGAYCHACGERRPEPELLSARHFFREFTDDVFDLDSRAIRTVRLLVARPGFLTLEYIAGRRKPYVGPLRMYLAVFAVLLFLSLLAPQASPQQGTEVVQGFRHVVHWLAVQRNLTDAAAEKALNDTVAQHITWLSVLVPLVFAAFLYAVFHRRRRWFGEHLVFATHFATFNYLVGVILIPFQLFFLRFGRGAVVTMDAVTLLPMFVYTVIAVRRVYGTGGWGAAAAALGLFLALGIAQGFTWLLAVATAVFKIAYFGV